MRGGKRIGAGRPSSNRSEVLYVRVSPESLYRIKMLAAERRLSLSDFINWMFKPV